MKVPTTAKTPAERSYGSIAFLLLCLVAILACLFRDIFKPEQVLFANDGPLGVLKTEALKVPAALTGYWMDLNWIGMNGNLSPISLTYALLWFLGPVGYAKFYGPITLLLLGLCAATFFRTLKLPWALCTVAALAAALNMNFFSNTCWGLGSRSSTLAMIFLALAAVQTRRLGNPCITAALAGLAVGMAVIEGADNGVIFSFFVAAYVLFQSLVENKTVREKVISATRVGIVALFAGFIAIQVLIPLIGIASKPNPNGRHYSSAWSSQSIWPAPTSRGSSITTIRINMPVIRSSTSSGTNPGNIASQFSLRR